MNQKSHHDEMNILIGFCLPTCFYKIQNLCKEMDLDVLEDSEDIIINRSIYVIGNKKKLRAFCNKFHDLGCNPNNNALSVLWVHEHNRNEHLQRVREKHEWYRKMKDLEKYDNG